MTLKKEREQVETCFGTSCNFCERNCPIYKVLRLKTYTSRGKNRALLGLLDGRYEPSEKMAEVVYTCTLCGACDAYCALDNTERFKKIREELVKRGLAREDYANAVGLIRERGDVYGRVTGTGSLAQETKDGEFPLYIGCQYRGDMSQVGLIVKVLARMGVNVRVSEQESCCGYVAHLLGYNDDVPEIVKRFKEVFPYERFLTLCPSCTLFTREAMGLEPVHAVLHAHRLIKEGKVKLKKLDMKATWHDPCDLGRRLGIFDEPREILEAMGIEVLEMQNNREFSLCCGAGGGMAITDPELVEEMAKQRMKQAMDTGADVLITACPTCESTLLTGSILARKEWGKRVKVMSIWEVLDMALDDD